MRFLGIDFGSKRVGVALSDENREFALPHTVLKNDHTLLLEILRIAKENNVSRIVIGESRDLLGNPNPIQKDIIAFRKMLESESTLPVEFELEFFTSAQAVREQGENEKLDASAAALILQGYLDTYHGNV